MIVVSDTTPLNYLILIDAVDVLRDLFTFVRIPPSVLDEMKHPRAPEAVRLWAESPPAWAVVQEPRMLEPSLPAKLHRGELEAISLAIEVGAEWVLLDDWDARQAAKMKGLRLAGTRNILEEAACRGLLEIELVIVKLRNTNYRATEEQYRISIENVRMRANRQATGDPADPPEAARESG